MRAAYARPNSARLVTAHGLRRWLKTIGDHEETC
jgi:hypothetical protein